MKKIVGLLLSLALVFALAVPTFAATKNDVIAELNAGVTVNGTTKAIPSQYIKVATDFLNANEYTATELDGVVADIKDAKTTWANTGKVNFKDIPADVRQQLVDKAVASAKKLGATLTFDGKTIKVVDKNGKAFSVSTGGDNAIKATGFGVNTNGMVAVSAIVVVTLAASMAFAWKKNLLGAK